jgi:transcriptional regulator with GAF, ATPase, and Fis domain
MPLPVQAKVLRVLQEKTFERVGGNETLRADVRVLAATNRNLEQAINDGSFREDLYHRLNVVTITIPPLRERRGDIPKLVRYFVDRYSRELKIESPVISDEAHDELIAWDWPGNIRELEHCIYRTLIFTHGYPIKSDDIRRARGALQASAEGLTDDVDEQLLLSAVRRHLDKYGGEAAHERIVTQLERLVITEALRRSCGNQSRAAQLLGLPRPTLHAKIQRYRLGHVN